MAAARNTIVAFCLKISLVSAPVLNSDFGLQKALKYKLLFQPIVIRPDDPQSDTPLDLADLVMLLRS